MKIFHALAGITFIAALAASSAEARGLGQVCKSISETGTYLPGDADFEGAIEFANKLVDGGESKSFREAPAASWQLIPDTTAWLKITTTDSSCAGIAASAAHAKFTCTEAGCNESIPSLEHLDVGATVSTDTCNSATGVQTKITWVKQADGTWTVTNVNQDLHVNGCPTT